MFELCGVVPHVDPGFYPTDWHLHRGEEVFRSWLERSGATRTDDPLPGDVGLWKFGRCFSHGGILVGEETVVHSYIREGVILTRLCEYPLAGREVEWWSVIPRAAA